MNARSTESTVIEMVFLDKQDAIPSVVSWLEMSGDVQISLDDNSYSSTPVNDFTAANFSDVTAVSPGVYQTTLAVILAIFCAATVFGNVLVMVAIFKQQYLHTVTNYFIASLAIADCLVGAVVMPFSVIHEVMDKYWIFGREWCDLWRCLDVLASTASILNLCAISIDRYWAITDPMTYPSKMTPPRAKLIVALVWMCSALISFPAIAWWRAVSEEPYPENQCLFTNDVGYLLFSSIISFYGPLMVMVFTYCRIYRAAVRQTKSLKIGMKHIRASNEPCQSMTLRIHRGGTPEHTSKNNSPTFRVHRGGTPEHAATSKNNSPSHAQRNSHLVISALPTRSESSTPKSPENNIPMRFASRHVKAFSISKKLGKLTKERKAAKTLGIVMGVFILCWLPFFIVNVLVGICGESCIAEPELVSSIVTWLGWINSGMNPVIYACWSRDFRRAFRQLLCSCCKTKKQQYRFQTTMRHNALAMRPKSPNQEVFL
ncbi:dopamine receptor 2-like [Uloborus diversus]|uniref:dopamine receptor 2-like n=1 Tax=Uloborus diversus TaxID=327109 RepID=UPI0024099D5E|nr:dopamine receptor 2-like [Uloborus diversus]